MTLATNLRSSKLVVLLTGMVSLIYALANPIIYGKMSMRYWWAYKRVFSAMCMDCGEKPRSWSISFSTNSELNVLHHGLFATFCFLVFIFNRWTRGSCSLPFLTLSLALKNEGCEQSNCIMHGNTFLQHGCFLQLLARSIILIHCPNYNPGQMRLKHFSILAFLMRKLQPSNNLHS